MKRIRSIDLVRGIIMIIMALDHTRDLFHISSLTHDPVDLETTNPALFFTRWITHICAPGFVFLSGLSAYISLKARNNFAASRRFLFKRGLWLIILELTVVNFGIWFDWRFSIIIFQVIGAIGFSFVLLALLLRRSSATLGFIGLAIIFLHNLLVLIPEGTLKTILSPLFASSFMPLTKSTSLLLAYPPIPWLGIMLAGFAFASRLYIPEVNRPRLFLYSGITCLVLFVVLRFINIYGDPVPWKPQQTPLFTAMSFLNLTKYPPSLLYDLATLGIIFMLLFMAEKIRFSRITGAIEFYGRVPLVYYLVHWYLLHVLMFVLLYIQGFTTKDFVFGFNFGRPLVTNGLPLWGVYIVWICVVAALYPLCRWYNRYKETHRDNQLLRYL